MTSYLIAKQAYEKTQSGTSTIDFGPNGPMQPQVQTLGDITGGTIEQGIARTAEQIKALQEQIKKEGVKDNYGNWVIRPGGDASGVDLNNIIEGDNGLSSKTEAEGLEEYDKYLKEAQEYYGYNLPTNESAYKYPEEMQELEKEATTIKQRLQQDWEQYKEDINTGKLRAGTDEQLRAEQALNQKTYELQQYETNLKTQTGTLNRKWIGQGGLFSGVRAENVGQYRTTQEQAKQNYLTDYDYTQGQKKTAYERTIEDYGTQLGAKELTYNRDVEDVALQRVRAIRNLNTKYQEAIGNRMGQSGNIDWQKATMGY